MLPDFFPALFSATVSSWRQCKLWEFLMIPSSLWTCLSLLIPVGSHQASTPLIRQFFPPFFLLKWSFAANSIAEEVLMEFNNWTNRSKEGMKEFVSQWFEEAGSDIQEWTPTDWTSRLYINVHVHITAQPDRINFVWRRSYCRSEIFHIQKYHLENLVSFNFCHCQTSNKN